MWLLVNVSIGDNSFVVMMMLVVFMVAGRIMHSLSGFKAHKDVLPQPGLLGLAHCLCSGAWQMLLKAHCEFTITFTKLMGAGISVRLLCLTRNAIGSSAITFPLERHEIWKLPLKAHTSGGGVTPIMHFTARVNGVDGFSRPHKSAETAVALEA